MSTVNTGEAGKPSKQYSLTIRAFKMLLFEAPNKEVSRQVHQHYLIMEEVGKQMWKLGTARVAALEAEKKKLEEQVAQHIREKVMLIDVLKQNEANLAVMVAKLPSTMEVEKDLLTIRSFFWQKRARLPAWHEERTFGNNVNSAYEGMRGHCLVWKSYMNAAHEEKRMPVYHQEDTDVFERAWVEYCVGNKQRRRRRRTDEVDERQPKITKYCSKSI